MALQRAPTRAIYHRSLSVGVSVPPHRLSPLEGLPVLLADLVTTLDVDSLFFPHLLSLWNFFHCSSEVLPSYLV